MAQRPRRLGSRAPSQPIGQRQRKLTTTERGYGWDWQKLRLRVLADEPLCRACAEHGLVTVAQEVDHIDGDAFNRDRANLRPLCRPCHLARTARDQAFGRMQWRPDWLRPSIVPLTIVCGPPAGGKSTWVSGQAGPRDLVIDLDAIAAGLSGHKGHDWDRAKWLVPSIRARNELLGDVGRQAGRWPAAWLILSEPDAAHRQWWVDKVRPSRIVVMETPASICIQRARADEDRNVRATELTIQQWWQRYSRRAGDEVLG